MKGERRECLAACARDPMLSLEKLVRKRVPQFKRKPDASQLDYTKLMYHRGLEEYETMVYYNRKFRLSVSNVSFIRSDVRQATVRPRVRELRGPQWARPRVKPNGPANIGAKIMTYTILGFPSYSYSIMGPKTLF